MLDYNSICLGCGRTIQEIAQWSSMNDQEKQQVIDRLNDDHSN